VHFLGLFDPAPLVLYISFYIFPSLESIPSAFIPINSYEFLIFLVKIPKNKKNTSISTMCTKVSTFDLFSSKSNKEIKESGAKQREKNRAKIEIL